MNHRRGILRFGLLITVVTMGVGESIPLALAGSDEIEIVGTWTETTCGTGADVWADGDLAFWGHFGIPCVDILDISDPSNPQWLSSFEPPGKDQFTSAQDVKAGDGLAFVAYEGDGNNGAGIVDVRDPANPVQLTTVRVVTDEVDFTDLHNLFYHQGYLYLATSRSPPTVAIVDLTEYDPDNPPARITRAKWNLTDVGGDFVHDITVQGNRLYVFAWSQVVVYDISNIDSEMPTRIGDHSGSSAHSGWATDDQRFLVTAEERSGGGIKLFEVTENESGISLTLLDEVVEGPGTFSAHNPLIVGNRVYTAWYGSGLIVHKIDADEGRLVELGRIDPGDTWGAYPLEGVDRVVLSGFGYFAIVDATLCGLADHDFNGDNRVDMADFAAYQRCFGEANGVTGDPACAPIFDSDCDGQIGLGDLTGFMADMTGP